MLSETDTVENAEARAPEIYRLPAEFFEKELSLFPEISSPYLYDLSSDLPKEFENLELFPHFASDSGISEIRTSAEDEIPEARKDSIEAPAQPELTSSEETGETVFSLSHDCLSPEFSTDSSCDVATIIPIIPLEGDLKISDVSPLKEEPCPRGATVSHDELDESNPSENETSADRTKSHTESALCAPEPDAKTVVNLPTTVMQEQSKNSEWFPVMRGLISKFIGFAAKSAMAAGLARSAMTGAKNRITEAIPDGMKLACTSAVILADVAGKYVVYPVSRALEFYISGRTVATDVAYYWGPYALMRKTLEGTCYLLKTAVSNLVERFPAALSLGMVWLSINDIRASHRRLNDIRASHRRSRVKSTAESSR